MLRIELRKEKTLAIEKFKPVTTVNLVIAEIQEAYAHRRLSER